MQNHKNNHILGQQGEKTAEGIIKNMGMKILERNYRCPYGEIDIIAQDEDCIVFIEVKYRKSAAFGHPLEAVDLRKQEKIRNSALYYIAEKGIEQNVRFDAAAILNTEFTYIKNAF